MNEREEIMQDSTREKIKEAAQSGLVQLVFPGVMTIAMFFLVFTVNRLSDHFDRIDAHLANTDTTNSVMRRDVDEQGKTLVDLAAQVKETRREADQTAWTVGEMQRDHPRR